MNAEDQLWRGTACQGMFRVFAVNASLAVQTVRDLHDLSPVNTLLQGKLFAAAAMLSLDLKAADAEVTLRVDGDGPLRGALAICTATGDLRGYCFEPQLYLEPAEENFYPVRNLGTGTLSVIRSAPNQRPISGFTELVEGELAQNLAHYYEQSEQLPSAVNLGVLIDKDATVRAAGGFIIQQLPGADLHDADRLIANLARTPNVSDLMDMGLSLREILDRFALAGMDFSLLPVHPVQFRCSCSRDRFARALRMLSLNDLEDLSAGIDPRCNFCNREYHFSPDDISQIINKKEDAR